MSFRLLSLSQEKQMQQRIITIAKRQSFIQYRQSSIALTPRHVRPELFGSCQVRRGRPYAIA